MIKGWHAVQLQKALEWLCSSSYSLMHEVNQLCKGNKDGIACMCCTTPSMLCSYSPVLQLLKLDAFNPMMGHSTPERPVMWPCVIHELRGGHLVNNDVGGGLEVGVAGHASEQNAGRAEQQPCGPGGCRIQPHVVSHPRTRTACISRTHG